MQVNQLQSEVERLQRDNDDLTKKMEKMSADHGKLQEYSKQQKVQLEQQHEKVRALEVDIKRQGDSGDKMPSTTSATSAGNYLHNLAT